MAKILIVEDNPANMKLACLLLLKAGHAVVCASDAETSLTLACTEQPDLILMDIQLPGMDGLKATALLKANLLTASIPVIALTAMAMKEDGGKIQLAGCEAYITKPLRYQELYEVINTLLAKAELSAMPDTAPTQLPGLRALEDAFMTDVTAQTVLIVDDEVQNRKLLEVLLQPEGYRTLTAANGEEALRLIADHSPDLILLDIMMPGIDGYELAVILKADAETSHIPIIMVTALTDRDTRLAGLNAGAEEFLTKPVDRTELWLRVRNLLRLKTYGDLQKQAQTEILNLNARLEERVQKRTAQLQASNQELQSFAYSVSHDLRTPLSSISGFSSLLAREVLNKLATERTTHYIARIHAGVQQMGATIDALLSLTHISRTALRLENVDLSSMADKVLRDIAERNPSILVKLDIQPGLLARGDPTLLRQAMENLLGNAWKFSSRQTKLHIAFTAKNGADGKTVYAIQDNGAGFDMTYREKLFSPFQRLHSMSEFPGTGIGLATVHRIVARHGGKVWAESKPGCGATFYFTLGKPEDACALEPA